ncbi:DUF1838 family protein [Parasphingorhabdus sp.]|uniref:DUF1838 family protein n=1 Tax=Parasphingorhabdus sp. TaxID=2709688 RepID=UPI003A8D43C7
MIARRQFIRSVAAISGSTAIMPNSLLAAASAAQPSVRTLDPLETMIRMRARTDGALSIAWLEAQRELVAGSDINPFCKLYAMVLTKFRKEGDAFIGNTVEITYYCDLETGELLETTIMPGGTETVEVPIYRSGPQDVRFKKSLDEWEKHDPKNTGASSGAFAPAAWVHLVRGVHDPSQLGDKIYLRADEYGRVYIDRSKPPSVFYREWIVWQADARQLLETDNPDVPSSFSYSAASGLRPWMKLEGVQGHTMSNGVGAKVERVDQLPPQLIKLLQEHDPRALESPESYFS